jgi:hypothetical protein
MRSPAREPTIDLLSEARTRRAARRDWVQLALRTGMAAQAVVYLLLAYLVARIADGALAGPSTSKPASGPGVAEAVANQPGGHAALFVLAVGLLLYALFSLVDAVLHHNDESPAAKRWGDRALSFWGFVVYGLFCGYCVSTAVSSSSRGGQSAARSDQRDTQWSARVLAWPGGQAWLALLGAVLFVIAAFQLARAARRSFRPRLKRHEMGRRSWAWAMCLGCIGYFGRALLFGIVGWYVTGAAIENDPRRGQGVDGSIRLLAGSAAGPVVLWILTATLLCYAAYLFVETRFRRVG